MDVIKNRMSSCLMKLGKLLLLLAAGLFLSVQHIAAEPSAPDLTADQNTDLDTGAIEPADSVRNNPDLLYVIELLLRAPVSQLKDGEPPYDQEPPDAQDDFRTRVEPPVPTEPPVPPPMPTEQPPPMPTEPPPIPTGPPPFPTLLPPPIPTEPPPPIPTEPPTFPQPGSRQHHNPGFPATPLNKPGSAK